jgi:hypothetical protein
MTIVHGMPASEYHALDRISVHGLMLVDRSPAHFMASKITPRAATPAQQLGTMAHLAVLEPAEFTRLVVVAPECDRRTNAGKAAWAEFQASLPADALIATQEQYDAIRRMADAVRANPFAAALLSDGIAEASLLWTDEETGVACKARPDWICSGHAALVDIKTAADASPDAFAKAAGSWRYHVQDAWYTSAALACGFGQRTFVFVVVETEPPHAVALYTLDEQSQHAGHVRARRALERYAECRKTGHWPAYAEEIKSLTIPKWAL